MIVTIAYNSKIRSRNKHLYIEREEGVTKLPYKDITVLVIEGLSSSISIQCLLDCVAEGIYVICCDKKFYPSLHIIDLYSNYKISERIHEQVLWNQHRKEECFRKIIVQKIQHQKDVLKYFNKDIQTITYMEELQQSCIEAKDSLQAIISTEGVAARVYFQSLFSKSFRRFGEDVINHSLNYGYGLLRNMLTKYVVAKGLHPALGIHHSNMFNKYNLVDDCIEVLRPMVDYIVHRYCLTDETSFNPRVKEKMLQLFVQKIIWEDKEHSITYCIEKYVDSLIQFMNMNRNELILPYLDIGLYDYQ